MSNRIASFFPRPDRKLLISKLVEGSQIWSRLTHLSFTSEVYFFFKNSNFLGEVELFWKYCLAK
jgi:hypothetical protein